MGEFADWYIDTHMDDFFDDNWDDDSDDDCYQLFHPGQLLQRYKDGTLYWKSGEGKFILIQDMTNVHIRNCIGYLEKQTDLSLRFTEFLIALKTENQKRLDDAFKNVDIW